MNGEGGIEGGGRMKGERGVREEEVQEEWNKKEEEAWDFNSAGAK